MYQLNLLISVVTAGNGSQNVSYDEVKNILIEADRDINNSNYLRGIYDQTLLLAEWDNGSSWNREHVWPQSFLTGSTSSRDMTTDAHNLRASLPSINNSRGNKYFDNTTTTNTYYPSDIDKGDVARILLYMVVRYQTLSLGNTTGTNKMANLEVLYQWHLDDPVDEFERQRNDVIYSYQGNRNPFIDNPQWFVIIWEYLMDEAGIQSNLNQTNALDGYLTIMVIYDPNRKGFSFNN